MRKIAIIGGTGIYSPETLQCFEEKVIQTALKYGVSPRVELNSSEEADRYLEM